VNHEAFLLAMGRGSGRFEERDESRIHWVIGGAPVGYHNAVVRADLAPDEVDTEIEASIEAMRRHGVAGSWHVGPSMRPADLPERLAARGFEEDAEPGMAADLTSLLDCRRPHRAWPSTGSTPRRTSRVYVHALGQGFGEGPPEAEWVGRVFAATGLGDDTLAAPGGPARRRAGGHSLAVPHRGRRRDLFRLDGTLTPTARDRRRHHSRRDARGPRARPPAGGPRLLVDGLRSVPPARLRGALRHPGELSGSASRL